MSDYIKEESNNNLKIKKSYEKLSKENKELLNKIDYITKIEIINAIKIISKKLDLDIKFTFDKLKNDI